MHLLKGQLEIESSLYAEAILSLTKAITKNQSLKEAYLERATAYFKLGKYDLSMEDYLEYSENNQKESSLSKASFSWAFAKNLPLGAYESGKGLSLFLSDLVTHPIHTAKQVWESLNLLGKLAATKEWEELSKLNCENTAKFAEAIKPVQTTVFLGEELGFTAKEMGQLKQAGKLEGVINSGLENIVSQSESEVLKSAISRNKHVKMVKDYLDKPAKEIQKGVNSYEKQIALHKDKITNPAKHCPDWGKLDPRQREALVNKKWPAEIQVFEGQRNALQSILNERLSYE